MLVASAECPGFQLQDREVVGLRQTAVIKGKTGAASAKEQPLVHPQTKVTTSSSNGKRVQISFDKKRVFPSPMETLKAWMRQEQEGLSSAIKCITRMQRM